MSPSAALEVNDVTMAFSGLYALTRVSLSVAPHEILGLIGPNGSGKTTLLNCVSGVYHPTSGRIALNGRDITHAPSDLIAEQGLRRTFQQSLLVPNLSVLENVLVGAHGSIRGNLLSAALTLWDIRTAEGSARGKALAALKWLGIDDLASVRAESVGGPARKLVELARAIVAGPRVLLLDEVASGLNSAEKETLALRVREIRNRFDAAIVLVEHDLDFVMSLAERVVVLNSGQVIADGDPALVQRNSEVIDAYIGV